MSIADWTGRLTTIGASSNEVQAITASYYASQTAVQSSLDTLVGTLSNAELLVMLTTWRTSGGPFEAGYPSGGLPFGTGVAVLTGNPADDTKAISAGTGLAISPSGVPSGVAGGDLSGSYPNPGVAKLNGVAASAYALLASPALTGTPTAPTKGALDNSAAVASTAYADAAVAVEKGRAAAVEATFANGTGLPASVVSAASPFANGNVIDLISDFGVSPGSDITTALQTAINQLHATGAGGEIIIAKAGQYGIDGVQQTGAYSGTGGGAWTYNASGQILYPATPMDATMQAITIRGLPSNSAVGADQHPNGVVLVTNATSGNVFDMVPTDTAYGARNGIKPVFVDIGILAPTDPQCGAIKALLAYRFQSRNLTILANYNLTTGCTGSGYALCLPYGNNSGDIQVEAQITGFPVGIALSEHAVLQRVYIGFCKTGLRGLGAGHPNKLVYVDIEESVTALESLTPGGDPYGAAGGMVLEGLLDGENVTTAAGFAMGPFVSDWNPNGSILGSIRLASSASSWKKGFGLLNNSSGGLNKRVANTLDIAEISAEAPMRVGWTAKHPIDDFSRVTDISGGGPGLSYPSRHPGYAYVGSFNISGGHCTGTQAAGGNRALIPALPLSRTVTATINLAASGNFKLLAHQPLDATGAPVNSCNANILWYYRTASQTLFINGVSVWTGAGAATGAHTLQLKVVYDGLGNPATVRGYADGTLVFTYGLSAAQKTALAIPAGSKFPYLFDGFDLVDTGTYVSAFSAPDAPPSPPALNSGIATLVAGTVDVADTNITASSIVRLNRQAAGGTLGELSVALTAGTKLTINSNNAADTSTVHYEIVSY